MKVLIVGSSSKVYRNLKNNEDLSSIDFFEISRSKPSSLKLLDSCSFYEVVISFVHVVDSFDENKIFYKSLESKIRKKYNRFIYIGSPVIDHSGFILSDGNDYLSIKYKMKNWVLSNVPNSEILDVGYNYSMQPPPFLLFSLLNLKFFYCKSNTKIDILNGSISSLLNDKKGLKLVLMKDLYPNGIYLFNFIPVIIINLMSKIISVFVKIYNILNRI
tara:strand:- start:1251 stop:1901 length:651 start_codon:yes stop_codon:yes gene_type:complete